MTREEQINKAIENLLDEAEVDILDRPLLRMWYKLGVNFADKNPIDRTDWQQVRIQSAIAAMKGLISNPDDFTANKCPSGIAKKSNLFADALVKELKGE